MRYPAEYKGAIPSRKEDQARDQFARLQHVIARLKPRTIMDLGCGMAFIDVFIGHLLRPCLQTIDLVDGNGTVDQVAGFKNDTRAWADVEVGAAVVRENLPGVNVRVWQADNLHNVQWFGTDLVISCRSWGHHYPISVHLESVCRILRPGGHLITDIRNETKGLIELKVAGFRVVEQIPDPSFKCKRWLLQRAEI